jgi:hypothetical protein
VLGIFFGLMRQDLFSIVFSFPPVLRIRIRIRKDPYHFSGSGSVCYPNGTTKLTGRENLTKNTFSVGPVGPSDKENQVKMFKKYSFTLRYIAS